jgi:hypothetical protein
MIVAVYARYADFCGNVDHYLHGYYEVDDIEQARAIFPEQPLCGWKVEKQIFNIINQLPATVQKVPQERHYK